MFVVLQKYVLPQQASKGFKNFAFLPSAGFAQHTCLIRKCLACLLVRATASDIDVACYTRHQPNIPPGILWASHCSQASSWPHWPGGTFAPASRSWKHYRFPHLFSQYETLCQYGHFDEHVFCSSLRDTARMLAVQDTVESTNISLSFGALQASIKEL